MKLSFFGDSHIQALRLSDKRAAGRSSLFPEWGHPIALFSSEGCRCKVRYFGSSSAVGLANGRSDLGVAAHIQKYAPVDLNEHYSHFLFCFGRVDLDFVWPFKQLKGGTSLSFSEFSAMSASSMVYSLLRLRDKAIEDRASIWVLGLPLPVLNAEHMAEFVVSESIMADTVNGRFAADDGPLTDFPHVAEMVSTVIPTLGSLEMRTEMTLEHNERLNRMASECGFGFVDVGTAMLDARSGIAQEQFLNPRDHHAMPETLGPLWMHEVVRSVDRQELGPVRAWA